MAALPRCYSPATPRSEWEVCGDTLLIYPWAMEGGSDKRWPHNVSGKSGACPASGFELHVEGRREASPCRREGGGEHGGARDVGTGFGSVRGASTVRHRFCSPITSHYPV